MQIRIEQERDLAVVRRLNTEVFESPAEAGLVDLLREAARPIVSLVGEDVDGVVGHIMFSPVYLSGHVGATIMGLAPMAVAPQRQRQNIGSALVHAGLQRCTQLGCGAVVVLGHAGYYPRFGFAPASRFGIRSRYVVPDDVFMAMELQPGYLRGRSGTITYHEAFENL